ncbi:mechanosensitive ion channel protein 6-like [Magnolia sinica]|uniref:mechanosensitive ion channel protein 6-like n=1 Tax=Magnolia sinica TaxID=86752 RepID=UPI00265978C7|nr:mechanosensitive ion channel protein 6-like [Magnolia sinica]
MDSFRKSLKSNSSYNQIGQKPAQGNKERPIPIDEEEDLTKSIDPWSERKEVVVKIDGSRDVELGGETNENMWRESSYKFWKDETDGLVKQQENVDDPPSKLISEFLNKQKEMGETSIDMDLEMDLGMDELLPPQDQHLLHAQDGSKEQRHPNTSKELKVSFQSPQTHHIEISSDSMRRRYKGSSDEDDDDSHKKGSGRSGEVMKCTSNASFKPSSSMLRSKTKSRLLDPPVEETKKSGMMKSGIMKPGMMKSGQMKSGLLGGNEDEDDPFFDEDIPYEFKKSNLSVVFILEWVSLIIILVIFIFSLSIPYLRQKKVWNLPLWKWEVLILVLICGRLVSSWVIKIAVFFIEWNFLLRKRVLYFVYGLRKAVQNSLWLGMVLLAWECIFDKKVKTEMDSKPLAYVTKILLCFLVATLLWLLKTLLVKVLASSFHVSTYFDRIQDALFNQYLIETLSGPPLIEIQQIREEEEKVMAEMQRLQNAGAKIPADLRATLLSGKSGMLNRGSIIQRSSVVGKSSRLSITDAKGYDGITLEHLHMLNQKNVSAWNMKRLMNIVRRGVLSTTLDERISELTNEDESTMLIRSEFEAKAAARKIYKNVAKPGSKYIYMVDLMRFMLEEEALKAMYLFEGAKENHRVNKTALKNWVVEAFKERRALSLTLNDTKTAVNKLHQMVNCMVGIIVVILSLLILGIATTNFLVFVSSQLVMVVFIFGNTCKMIFEAIIFLFVMHPFDVGDRCEVEGNQMIVEEMNILTTVFLRHDNLKITYPNSVLSTYPISNFYRSPNMGDAIDFCVHVSTPVEKVVLIKEKLKE